MKINRSVILFIVFLITSGIINAQSQLDTAMTYPNDEEKGSTEGIVYTVVEKMPVFPGGEDSLFAFIARNSKYPIAEVKEKSINRVYVTFVISHEGKVTGAQVLRGKSELFDKEAIRILKIMPSWIPGSQNGKNVNVAYNLPVNFK
jgi:TonB family protein